MSSDNKPLVLIADCDPDSSTRLRSWLELESCQVVSVDSLEAWLAAHPAPPDLVITSGFPNGFQAVRRLRGLPQGKLTPVLMIVSEETINRAFEAGADDILTLPLHPPVVRHRARHLLQAAGAISRRAQPDAETHIMLDSSLLRTLIDSLPDNVFVKDRESRFRVVNRQIVESFGRTDPQEVIGKTDFDFSPPELAGVYYAAEQELLNTGEPILNREEPGPERDGRPTWFLSAKFPLRDAQGSIIGLVGVSRDITELKQAREDLQRANAALEQRVEARTAELTAANAALQAQIAERQQIEAAEREQRLLAEALRDTAAAINSTLNLNDVLDRIFAHVARVLPHDAASIMFIEDGCARIARMWGYAERGTEAELLGRGFPISNLHELNRVIASGHAFIIPDTHSFDQWLDIPATRWVRAYIGAPIQLEGKVFGIFNLDSATPNRFTQAHAQQLQAFADQAAIAIQNAQLYDTVRRHAEELEQRVAERTAELESERAQLRAILEGMREGVMGALDYEGRVPRRRYINQAMYDMLGYTAQEWNPFAFKSAAMTDEQFMRVFEKAERTVFEKGFWRGQLRLRRKDGSEFDSEMTITRLDRPDGALGSVMLLRDISEEKALQEQKDRFVAYASHELRTPITNLKTRLYLIHKQPEKLAEHLVILDEVTDRMKKLVECLLDLSRFRSGVIPLERCDVVVQELVENIIRLQQPEAERASVRLLGDLPAAPLHLEADPERLAQVITNLVTNAIHHTPEGGEVLIRCTADPENDVAIHVIDSGVGIAAEHIPYIFQPFYRIGDSGTGTGLGLSISREIVEQHGGILSVESQPGRGSCFTVRLKR